MKRILALAVILLAAASSRDISRAQTSSTLTPTPTPSPTITPTTTPAIDPTHFTLTQWDFPPPSVITESRVESNATASAETRLIHFGPGFDVEGRITGYYEFAATPNVDSHGADHFVFTYFLMSTFATPAAAAAAFSQQKRGWDAALTLPPAGLTVSQIPESTTQLGDQSSGSIYLGSAKTATGQVADVGEFFEQRGIYLIEAFQSNLQVDARFASRSNLLSVASTLDKVASGALVGPPPPVYPSKVKFDIFSTRFEPNGQPFDIEKNLKAKPITQISAGSRVQLATYFVVYAAKPNGKFSATFRVTRAKSSGSYSKTVTRIMPSYAPHYYKFFLGNVPFSVPGKYSVTVRVTVGKQHKTGSTHLTVTGHASRFRTLSAVSGVAENARLSAHVAAPQLLWGPSHH